MRRSEGERYSEVVRGGLEQAGTGGTLVREGSTRNRNEADIFPAARRLPGVGA